MIDLKKKAEAVGIDLKKKGMAIPPMMPCAADWDVSGSRQSMYRSGVGQTACDQVRGVALRLDDDGTVPTWTFDNRPYKVDEATPDDAGTFVQNKVLKSPHLWGGTQYAPVLQEITKEMTTRHLSARGLLGGLFGKKPAPAAPMNPALVFFQTDGDNDSHDHAPAFAALEEASAKDIFFLMIGVGGSGFAFLRDADRRFSNVSFIALSGLNNSDEAFYQAVLSEKFVAWAKKYPPRPAA